MKDHKKLLILSYEKNNNSKIKYRILTQFLSEDLGLTLNINFHEKVKTQNQNKIRKLFISYLFGILGIFLRSAAWKKFISYKMFVKIMLKFPKWYQNIPYWMLCIYWALWTNQQIPFSIPFCMLFSSFLFLKNKNIIG